MLAHRYQTEAGPGGCHGLKTEMGAGTLSTTDDGTSKTREVSQKKVATGWQGCGGGWATYRQKGAGYTNGAADTEASDRGKRRKSVG